MSKEMSDKSWSENKLKTQDLQELGKKFNKNESEIKEIEKRGTTIIKTEIELNKKGEPQLKKSIIPFDDFYIKPKTDLEKLEAATKILDRRFEKP